MTNETNGGVRVAVIGAGVSGVLTAIHLLWRCRSQDRVYLVERSAKLGPGVAYGTRHPLHLVNVRADNMSAFADEPDHFVKWLNRLPEEERAAAGRKTMAGLFVRREVYGRYVQDLLRDTIVRQGGAQNLYIVTDTATALRPAGAGLALETEGGRTYEVDAAVLAVGNFPPGDQSLPGYVPNPWAENALDGIRPDLPVAVLGTGLTAVDVVLMLQDARLQGADPRLLAPRPAAPGARAVLALVRLPARRRGPALARQPGPRRPPRGPPRRRGRRGLALRRRRAPAARAAPVAGAVAGRPAPLRAPPAALLGGPPPPHGAADRRGDRGGPRGGPAPAPERPHRQHRAGGRRAAHPLAPARRRDRRAAGPAGRRLPRARERTTRGSPARSRASCSPTASPGPTRAGSASRPPRRAPSSAATAPRRRSCSASARSRAGPSGRSPRCPTSAGRPRRSPSARSRPPATRSWPARPEGRPRPPSAGGGGATLPESWPSSMSRTSAVLPWFRPITMTTAVTFGIVPMQVTVV